MASKTQWLKATWPKLLLISLITALLSNITYAALPISADQVTTFDALGVPDFNDIDPPDNLIDDLTYEDWRYDKSTGSSPGIIFNNAPVNEDPATTKLKINTADGSEFRAVSIDYSAFPPPPPNPTPTYELTLQGYKDGAPVPGYIVAVANIVPPVALTTLSLNWDSVDEIRVAPSSDYIVFDNFSVGAVPPTPPGFNKNFSPTQIQAGQTSRLDFIIVNTTSVVEVTSLDFTDNLPAGVLVASPPNASTSCIGGTLTAVAGTGTVRYTGGTVPAKLGCAVFVDVTSANSGTYVNTSGDLTSSAGNSGTSTATLTVSPFPATIGGLLTGLVTGDNLVLQNNAGDDLTLTADGAFTFATPVNSGDPYAVTVLTDPTAPSETCTVSNGSGTTPAANVDTVSVTCSLNNYSVGGSLSGIAAGGTVVLQNNGADSRSLSADGFFTFSPQADGTNYAITVSTQPTDQTCTVTNGSGTLAGADITNASVTCVDNSPPPPNGGMPKAVPVMPLWLYGLMFTLIAGIGGIGFKRRL